MRLSLLLFSSLISFQAYGQYPATGNKQRLGYQTTGDGLVYRGNGSPAYTPSGINSAWAYIDTTAGTIYTYYAGSWHLVSAGGGGTFDGHVDSLVFNSSVTVVDSIGKMYYDASNETISVGIDGGAVYQMGQELYYPLVINKSGATILNGQPVMVDTATLVTGDHVRIIPARNGAAYPSDYVMGVATTDIPNDSTGLVTWFGYVREVKESDIAQTGVTIDAGDILYLSSTEPGKYTDTPPVSPAHKSTIALVVRKPSVNNITLLVRPWLAPKLDNLSNVNTSSVTGLSVLRYNSVTGTWDASATAGIVAADTAAMLSYYQKKLTNPITGTGTAGQVAYWSGTTTQTGSNNLFWDATNSRLGIGTNSPSNTFQIRIDQDNLTTANITNSNTGTTVAARQTLTAGNSSSSNSLYRELGVISFSKNYTNSYAGGAYAAGGATLLMYAGSDTTNNNITNAITYQGGGISESNYNPSFRWVKAITNSYTVANELMRLNKTGLGIKQNTPLYSLDINATDAIRIPKGTTAQRPTGAAGVVRYNTDNTNLEYHNGTAWSGLQSTITNPVTGTGASGQVAYWSGTSSQTGNNNLFYDATNARLGVGTNAPGGKITAYSNANTGGVIQNWNIDTGADTYAALANHVGNSSTTNSNFRLSALFAFPKNYTNSTYGGTYAAGGATLWMYGASDTTNNNITNAITYTGGGISESNYNPSFRWVKAITNNYTIANELMRLNKTGLGIKQNTPLYSLDINATDAIRIPSGTTVQRPTGAAAVLRYNSDSLRIEYHTGTAWKGIAKTEELPAATSGFPRAIPVAVILSTYTVSATDAWIICDYAGTVTLTLPSAASYPGREIMVKTIRAQSVVSASSNVVPIDSNTAGTAILAATAGKWATLVSTGSQWVIMQSN